MNIPGEHGIKENNIPNFHKIERGRQWFCSRNSWGGGYSKAAPKPLTTQNKFSLGFTLAIAALLFFLALALPARAAHATEAITIDGVTYQVNGYEGPSFTDAEGNYLPYAEIIGISTSQANKTIKVPASFTMNGREWPVFIVSSNFATQRPNGSYDYSFHTPGATLDFTNCPELRGLSAYGSFTKINVAGCTKLSNVWVANDDQVTPLSSLNLSGCTGLEDLWLRNTTISSVDVSSCKNLEKIDLYELPNLTSLDASGLSRLKSLRVDYCEKLGSIKLAGLSSLETLSLGGENGGRFSSVDLSQCPNLQILSLGSKYLTSLDLSKNMQLKELYFGSNAVGLRTLDLSNHSKLEKIHYNGFFDEGTDLRSANLSGCSSLKEVNLYWNPNLSSINLRGCSSLETVHVYGCNLTTLDLSASKKLKEVDCHDNKLTSLDLSGNPQLKEVTCAYNSLSTLNLSGCSALENIRCSYNNLTSLDVSSFPELIGLGCSGNKLKTLDITKNPYLTGLYCEDNYLTNTAALERWLNASSNHQGQVLPQKASSSSNNNNGSSATVSDGWKHNSKGWWYAYSNGTYAKGLQKIGNATYYFDSKGWMKTGWQHAKGGSDWYYFNKSGAMKNGWQKISGKWYYLDSTGKMLTGKQTISKKTYFLASSGAMRTGWVKSGSDWYYCNSSGAAATGWKKVSGKWYFMDSAGKMKTGWLDNGGKRYLLRPSSGEMITGWARADGKWYYFNKSGYMQKNKWVGNYFVESDGTMATSKWIGKYHVNSSGKWDSTRAA